MGYCGLDCADCGAYIVNQTYDFEFKQEMSDLCLLAGISLDAKDYGCGGCKAGKNLFGYCQECKVRICAVGRDVDSCVLCEDYPCYHLKDLFFLGDDDLPLVVVEIPAK